MADHGLKLESRDPGIFDSRRDEAASVLEAVARKIREGKLAGARVEWSASDPGIVKLDLAPVVVLDQIALDFQVDT